MITPPHFFDIIIPLDITRIKTIALSCKIVGYGIRNINASIKVKLFIKYFLDRQVYLPLEI